MIDRSAQQGTRLEKDVERLLIYHGHEFEREPFKNRDDKKPDFYLKRYRLIIEAKNRYDQKLDNLDVSETYIRFGKDFLTGVRRKVRDAYEQYEGQTYDPNAKLIIALSYTGATAKAVEDAICGRSYPFAVIDLETDQQVDTGFVREPSQVFTDEYPNLIGVLLRYEQWNGDTVRTATRYYPNIKAEWREHTPPGFADNLTATHLQSLCPTSIPDKWEDSARYAILPLDNLEEVHGVI